MYINNLGMRDEAAQSIAASVSTANTNNTTSAKSSDKKTSNIDTTNFPTAIKKAVESQTALFGENTEASLSIEEALASLKNDPEWKDVGTALTALYENQQKMQAQMSLLSVGYSSGLTGLSSAYSQYGLGSLTSAYGGVSNLLGGSIFANQLI